MVRPPIPMGTIVQDVIRDEVAPGPVVWADLAAGDSGEDEGAAPAAATEEVDTYKDLMEKAVAQLGANKRIYYLDMTENL